MCGFKFSNELYFENYFGGCFVLFFLLFNGSYYCDCYGVSIVKILIFFVNESYFSSVLWY